MKLIYPVMITPAGDDEFFVEIPDMDIATQGTSLENAIDMARDAISLMAVDMEDEGRKIPAPAKITDLKPDEKSIVTLVDADISAYRRMLDNRAVRKNCTIPSWLNEKAEAANINFSAVLQEALKQRLQIN